MSKRIISVGYVIPGYDSDSTFFGSDVSLMEADVLLISPEAIEPSGEWVNFSTSDGGCYSTETSRRYEKQISRLKKEITDLLSRGKTVFVLLSREEEFTLTRNVSVEKNMRSHSTYKTTNYNFLPTDVGTMTSVSGDHIEFSGHHIFNDFYSAFKEKLKYYLYIEGLEGSEVIFTGKDKTKVLGARTAVGNGNLVLLPYIPYDEGEFTEIKKDDMGEEKEFWTPEAIVFGENLTERLIQIDSALRLAGQATPLPNWVQDKKFTTTKEADLKNLITKEKKKISELENKIRGAEEGIAEVSVLKGLLFEQGKPLERAVTEALRILGYSVEGYDDGMLEIDHVIISPEGQRYIGECEGKDTKDINITKFRQLTDSMNADFGRDDVSKRALGILFGNPQRLTRPEERTIDFTVKCKDAASREKIALVKTPDLYVAIKYILETKDEKYKKSCRDAIHKGLGGVVAFPSQKIKE